MCRRKVCRSDPRTCTCPRHWRLRICQCHRYICTCVFLEVRTLLPALVPFVSTFKRVSAGPAGLPALVWHVIVLSHAILCELRCGGIVGDNDASLDKIGQLVSLVRLRLSPLVVHAGDGASYVHGLTGDCYALPRVNSAAGMTTNNCMRFIVSSSVAAHFITAPRHACAAASACLSQE